MRNTTPPIPVGVMDIIFFSIGENTLDIYVCFCKAMFQVFYVFILNLLLGTYVIKITLPFRVLEE